MKKQNTLNIQIINEDICKIEAKINPIQTNQSNRSSKPIDHDNTQLKSNTFMITSGSLNLSNTISNLSVQTMRISKNSNILQSNNLINNWGGLPVEVSLADEDKISLYASLDDNINPNISTNSIVFLKKSDKNILYTPSTICNYYLHSNEVTPNKSEMNKITKLDLNAVSIYDENVTENNECVSSFRNNLNNIEDLNGVLCRKTPIKYNKSQLRSTEKKKNSASPMETIFEKEPCKKQLVLNISELDIEDKILNEDLKTPTPNNFMERVNLNFTFNKICGETPEREIPVVKEDKKIIPKIEHKLHKISSLSKPNNDLKTILIKNKNKAESLYLNTIESKKERSISHKYTETSDYYTTTLGDRIETSPKITNSNKKTTQASTVKSKSSTYKKSLSGSNSTSKSKSRANEYLSSNNNTTTIKQFLLGMMEKKKDNNITSITNNINIDKIIIQNPILNPEKKIKKSNSIASDKKKKYKDTASIYSNKSSVCSMTPVFSKKNIKARSNSKNSENKRVIEFTINYDQNNNQANKTNSLINKNKNQTSPINTNNNQNKKLNITTVSPNIKTVYSKPNKTAKIITNFQNYTKKSNDKISPARANPEIKKQIVSCKIANVAGDHDDSFEIDDI